MAKKKTENKITTLYIAPDVLLKYVLNPDDATRKLLQTKSETVQLCTSSFAFWEMMSCLTAMQIKKHAMDIAYLFNALAIVDLDKKTQSGERKKSLRKIVWWK